MIQHFDQCAPYYVRQALKQWMHWANSHQILLCFDLHTSQVEFESLLDWMTVEYQHGLGRLQLNPIRTKAALEAQNDLQPLSVEYVRYTWLAGQKCL